MRACGNGGRRTDASDGRTGRERGRAQMRVPRPVGTRRSAPGHAARVVIAGQELGYASEKGAGKQARMQQRRPRELRIIAGEWRGRKLRFPDRTSIRPTPDRVRETLFNWIGAQVRGTQVLDLFAGSGALGLESLSRGAAAATFIDSDRARVQALRERLAEWGAQAREARGRARGCRPPGWLRWPPTCCPAPVRSGVRGSAVRGRPAGRGRQRPRNR